MTETSGEVTLACENHQELIVEGLWQFFLAKLGVDFDIQWAGRSVRAHRLVLDVFLSPDKLVDTTAGWPSSRQRQGDRNGGELDLLLQFLYQGKVTVQREQLGALLEMAQQSDFKILLDALQSVTNNLPESSPTVKVESLIEIDDDPEEQNSHPMQNAEQGYTILPDSGYNCDRSASGSDESSDQESDSELRFDTMKVEPQEVYQVTSDSSCTSIDSDGDDHDEFSDVEAVNEDGSRMPPPEFHLPDQDHLFDSRGCCGHEKVSRVARIKLEPEVSHTGSSREPVEVEECSVRRKPSQVRWSFQSARLQSPVGSSRGQHGRTSPLPSQDQFVPESECHEARVRTQQRWKQRRREPSRNIVLKLNRPGGYSRKKLHKCPYCGKSYQKSHLVTHLRIHTGERPFKCEEPLCQKSFARKNTLKSHKLSHTGEKPYRCDGCQRRFVQRASLNLHKRQACPNREDSD